MSTTDIFERPLRDLRISVTDRCNFRCTYCMPKEIFGRNYQFLEKSQLLSFEEIERIVRIGVGLGITKVRLTGGEPLMRREIEKVISKISEIDGVDDLAITTNGSFPTNRIVDLKKAGLKRITVSLDSLDDDIFKSMNDVDFTVKDVLSWIDACEEAGFESVKVNMVVKRGVNQQSILPLAKYFREKGHIVRFIEYMDVGHTNGWRLEDVVSADEIVNVINEEMPIEAVEPNYHGEVANRYHYLDGSGEIGVIASVTRPFCGNCSRLRVSADGLLYTCLFAGEGHDLRSLLRSGESDENIAGFIRKIWQKREDRYSELRTSQTAELQKVEMSYIGG